MSNSRKTEYMGLYCDGIGEFKKEFLEECFRYEDGKIYWRDRPESHFYTYKGFRKYCTSYMGREAGSKSKSSNKKNTYRHLSIYGKGVLVHRIIWVIHHGAIPAGKCIDHINGNSLDNRICNLRIVDDGENKRNMSLSLLNKSGVSGVRWDESRGRWAVSISRNYRKISLGRHVDYFDAVCARKAAEIECDFHINHGRGQHESKHL